MIIVVQVTKVTLEDASHGHSREKKTNSHGHL